MAMDVLEVSREEQANPLQQATGLFCGPNPRQEKPLSIGKRDRTKTDTGRRAEDAQALERTPVKELGKLSP
jgi:hypothetical protein